MKTAIVCRFFQRTRMQDGSSLEGARPTSTLIGSRATITLGLAIASLLTACVSSTPRGAGVCLQDRDCERLPTSEANLVALEQYQQFSLGFIEFNSWGKARNPHQVTRVTEEIRSIPEKGKALIVLFVHGWRHTARPSDDHVSAFRQSLRALAEMHAIEGRRVIGVYFGWPGTWLPRRLDVVTYLDRSFIAGRVAEGCGVRKALRDMSYAVAERKKTGADVVSVAIGHSLGGKLLFVPVEQRLEGDLRDCDPPRAPLPPAKDLRELFLFGDITILLNPAQDIRDYDKVVFEADKLCGPRPPNRMSTFSSEGDQTIRVAYRMGRTVRNLWPKYWQYFVSESIGLGWLPRQVTHDLRLPETPCTRGDSDTQRPSCAQLLSRDSEGDEDVLFPVIRVDSRIIKDHGDIFGHEFREFLHDYIANRVRQADR